MYDKQPKPANTPSQVISAFPPAWLDALHSVEGFAEDYASVSERVSAAERQGGIIYPATGARMRALELCEPEKVRCVILGQDPYHGEVTLPSGEIVPQAQGLSFSVPTGARLPPSLRNIFVELQADLGHPNQRTDGDLSDWAEQGVLLLNTVLTVQRKSPNSHKDWGWEKVTAGILRALASRQEGISFLLWGKSAQAYLELADLEAFAGGNRHTLIVSSHPSPMGGACKKFFGTRPFSRANQALEAVGRSAVHW